MFIGHQAVRGWWSQLYDAFDDLRFDANEFIDAGDHVLVPTTGTGHGGSSGAPVEIHFSNGPGRKRIAHNLIRGPCNQGIVVGIPDPFLGDYFGRGISDGNVVTDNVGRGGGIGIRAAQESSTNTLIEGNKATLGGLGIRAGSPSTALGENLVKENEGHGISAVRGVENLGGNVAVRNKGRPQCVHLHCRTVPPGT